MQTQTTSNCMFVSLSAITCQSSTCFKENEKEENLQNVALFISNEDPMCYEKVASRGKWKSAMDLEIGSIVKNETRNLETFEASCLD